MWPFKRKLYDEECGICKRGVKVNRNNLVEGGGGHVYSRMGKGNGYVCRDHKKSEIVKHMNENEFDTYFNGFLFTISEKGT